MPESVRARLAGGRLRMTGFSRPLAFWQRPLTGVAAAAAVLMVVGGVVFEMTGSGPAEAELRPQVAADLIARHDSCVASAKSHEMAGIPTSDMPRLAKSLNSALHEPVLAANLPEAGWHFRGGAVCSVAHTPVAHLIFDHAGASVSVFSLPAGAEPTPVGRFEERYNDHAIAGFTDSRGSFCFVGSGNAEMTPEHLAQIRDSMSADVVNVSWNDSGDRPAVAELLH